MSKKGVAVVTIVLGLVVILAIALSLSPAIRDLVVKQLGTKTPVDLRNDGFTPYSLDDIQDPSLDSARAMLCSFTMVNRNSLDFSAHCPRGISSANLAEARCDGVSFGRTCVSCNQGSKNVECKVLNFDLEDIVEGQDHTPAIIGGYGDPRWLLYYERFPEDEDSYWHANTFSVNFWSVGAAAFFGTLGSGGSIAAKTALKTATTKAANAGLTKATKFGIAKEVIKEGASLGPSLIITIVKSPYTIIKQLLKAKNLLAGTSAATLAKYELMTLKVNHAMHSGLLTPLEAVTINDRILKEVSIGLRGGLDNPAADTTIKTIVKEVRNSDDSLSIIAHDGRIVDDVGEEIVTSFSSFRNLKGSKLVAHHKDIVMVENYVSQFRKADGVIDGVKIAKVVEDDILIQLGKLDSLTSSQKKEVFGTVVRRMEALGEKELQGFINGGFVQAMERQSPRVLEQLATKMKSFVPDTATKLLRTGQTINKNRVYMFLAVGYMASLLDSQNEKWIPQGKDTLYLNHPTIAGGVDAPFTIDSSISYIALERDGGQPHERFHLVSPCNADFKVVSKEQQCVLPKKYWDGYAIIIVDGQKTLVRGETIDYTVVTQEEINTFNDIKDYISIFRLPDVWYDHDDLPIAGLSDETTDWQYKVSRQDAVLYRMFYDVSDAKSSSDAVWQRYDSSLKTWTSFSGYDHTERIGHTVLEYGEDEWIDWKDVGGEPSHEYMMTRTGGTPSRRGNLQLISRLYDETEFLGITSGVYEGVLSREETSLLLSYVILNNLKKVDKNTWIPGILVQGLKDWDYLWDTVTNTFYSRGPDNIVEEGVGDDLGAFANPVSLVLPETLNRITTLPTIETPRLPAYYGVVREALMIDDSSTDLTTSFTEPFNRGVSFLNTCQKNEDMSACHEAITIFDVLSRQNHGTVQQARDGFIAAFSLAKNTEDLLEIAGLPHDTCDVTAASVERVTREYYGSKRHIQSFSGRSGGGLLEEAQLSNARKIPVDASIAHARCILNALVSTPYWDTTMNLPLYRGSDDDVFDAFFAKWRSDSCSLILQHTSNIPVLNTFFFGTMIDNPDFDEEKFMSWDCKGPPIVEKTAIFPSFMLEQKGFKYGGSFPLILSDDRDIYREFTTKVLPVFTAMEIDATFDDDSYYDLLMKKEYYEEKGAALYRQGFDVPKINFDRWKAVNYALSDNYLDKIDIDKMVKLCIDPSKDETAFFTKRESDFWDVDGIPMSTITVQPTMKNGNFGYTTRPNYCFSEPRSTLGRYSLEFSIFVDFIVLPTLETASYAAAASGPKGWIPGLIIRGTMGSLSGYNEYTREQFKKEVFWPGADNGRGGLT